MAPRAHRDLDPGVDFVSAAPGHRVVYGLAADADVVVPLPSHGAGVQTPELVRICDAATRARSPAPPPSKHSPMPSWTLGYGCCAAGFMRAGRSAAEPAVEQCRPGHLRAGGTGLARPCHARAPVRPGRAGLRRPRCRPLGRTDGRGRLRHGDLPHRASRSGQPGTRRLRHRGQARRRAGRGSAYHRTQHGGRSAHAVPPPRRLRFHASVHPPVALCHKGDSSSPGRRREAGRRG